MRTSIILNDELVRKAMAETGVQEKTRLIHLGLETLVREAALRRLAQLRGSIKNARAPRRRRPS